MPVRRSGPSPKRTTRKTLPHHELAKPRCVACDQAFASMRAWERHSDQEGHRRCRFSLPSEIEPDGKYL